MANKLLSGPAGANKSERARELLEVASEPTVAADFTSLFNAVRLIERGPGGSFPERTAADEVYLPIAEAMRREVIRQGQRRGLSVVVTNSDGDLDRRRELAALLGDAELEDIEEVLDPGEDVVTARLSNRRTGKLGRACRSAIGRWYDRLPRIGRRR